VVLHRIGTKAAGVEIGDDTIDQSDFVGCGHEKTLR
jgi:hypothetical protein